MVGYAVKIFLPTYGYNKVCTLYLLRWRVREEMADFSSNIKLLRIASGLTWREWAKKCGVSLSSAQRYELEEVKPSYDVLLRISKNLRIPVAALSGQEPLKVVPGPEPGKGKKKGTASP